MSANHDWLNLIEVSGPFLAVPVLREVLPQGLEALTSGRPQRLRAAYDEWRDAVDADDPDMPAIHSAWIDEVLQSALEVDDQVLRRAATFPERLKVSLPEHGVTIAPDLAIVNPTLGDDPLLLVQLYDPDTDLDATRNYDGLATTPGDRMVSVLRAAGCPVGLVTNGERWMLVHAPAGAVASFASWYARLWGQEPETLRAFVSLLGVRRFFGPEAERLPALFERSLKHQDDVTDALGEQVRRAVEVLVQSLDRADQDRNRDLLHDVDPKELYEAGLTVMMRLVFLLAAEERGLLLLGDPRYDSFYALSSLRMQLRADSEEILERRRSAWSRLLALFRGVYGGIDHPVLRLPAMGGSLFDPDRYPFLEGRKKGTSWRSDPAEPLPIDDRTVLLLLEAIQTFEGRTLSYRALDVEQIGHVYEGLLERTVQRVDDVTLELEGSAKAKNARVALGEIESARLDGAARIIELLKERSERSEPAIRNAIGRELDERVAARLLTVCRGDVALRDRILPFAELLRTDPWGYPLVHHAGAFVVVLGADRRESGTHYTPKSLTKKIVEETLTPIVYRGPAEGTAREDWKLKSADELLDLKICDPAMGSGAFLVQACRWLADRMVEAWSDVEAGGGRIDDEGYIRVADDATGFEPLSRDTEERAILARRLIAERCLYGVDKNPLAVELAKLSLWLTTLAKGRPFGFLDHNLRSGDSLLGIHDLGQLIELDMKPKGKAQLRLFGRTIRSAVDKALELRSRLRSIPIRDIGDVEAMAALDAQSRNELALPGLIADALVGIVLADDRAVRITSLASTADEAAGGDANARTRLLRQRQVDLASDAPDGVPRRPLHWPLEFPEVFLRDNGGFDAFTGNPPFLGGQRITGVAGTVYRDWLVEQIAEGRRGSADLVAYFFLRAYSLLRDGGGFGLLAVNTIAEGDTRQVGLEAMISGSAVIHAAYPNEPWPGKAAVVTSRVHVHKGEWRGVRSLLGRPTSFVSAFLSDREEWSPKRLKINEGTTYQGSIVLGLGFVLSPEEAQRMLDADSRNAEVILPYLDGDDLKSVPEQKATRWAIDFWDWPETEARSYNLPYEYLEENVKSERLANNDKGAREKWWLYLRARSELYHAIGRGHHFKQHPKGWDAQARPLENILVAGRVGKYFNPSVVPNDVIFHEKCVVFAVTEPYAYAAIFNSSPVDAWVWKQSSRMKLDLNFSPSDAVETFPFLKSSDIIPFDQIGRDYLQSRRQVMTDPANPIGLTKLYNRFHDEEDVDAHIVRLREMHREIDAAVMRAYGWGDLDLGHGYHEQPNLAENDRVRFTISDAARAEVLRRFAELNRQRYEDEQAATPATKLRAPKSPRKATPTSQGALDLVDAPAKMAGTWRTSK
ncbi:Eco57I restriction-modification methylase domain-containing protein [Nguyenibacter vanlangensis]|uniref:site-specific DNA-methyltransferase (adenine-specific) n=1 Tax=Nguyenibacter vanlangensis TaxID=1216886 RepID=A0A7Y7IT04_9PROT|nr:type IIL restriction-modification enzyme MmeI [Nguyenibacter vanlangensis]NVN09814.1 ATP phosphoribosyltransferase regulatory subunit [Nguyenibacter vanlangensis]